MASEASLDVSVVVPAWNEAESLPELVARVAAVLTARGCDWEFLLVDDGSTDETWATLADLHAADPRVRGIRFARNYGKAAALAAGFEAAGGERIVTLDADLQDDPDEIPLLLDRLEDGFDLVSGWKQDRQDSWLKNNSSKVFNWATGRMCGLRLHDFNCGLKAYRREVTQRIHLYGDMHRYVPALAHLDGFRVTEHPVRHHKRRFGRTKYGWDRFLNGFLDLLTVYFLHARGSSPLHFFGRLGAVFGGMGGLISLYFLIWWLTGHALRVRPVLVLALVLMVMAVQFVSLGLIAELMVSNRPAEASYRVRDRL
ncbi:MAG TPA: glycosyltransferase family 2 protein [Candidatus Krumholzibacteria bacterium]|nr:glycosyltransferase family 2 protein [Candidatus Krumholzibacteria bacterium]HPD72766.1 glycosyltransferase family 2 protein [Candidatus Krumholzibacteria bacterium]HRY40302.1 glycosyltransferase family 2 protein [Candidatus Krumholzibacteria bacterium]